MKIIIGMSGGVDSSVAAYLLKEQGYEVTGVTLIMFTGDMPGMTHACDDLARKNIEASKRVAEIIGIKHETADMTRDFKKYVTDYFVDSYKRAYTPNPCLQCNKEIKFKKLFEYAKDSGAYYVATGHYAKIENDSVSGRKMLIAADDKSKDQAYLLYNLKQQDLSHLLFPNGSYSKKEIRDIAKTLGLPNCDSADSQDICFIPDGDYVSFIERYTGETIKEGYFKNKNGEILTCHNGQEKYTIGQRRGLGTGFGRRMFVCEKDAATNTVVLGDEEDLYSDILYADHVNMISGENSFQNIRVDAKIRYSHMVKSAVSSLKDGILTVEFDSPVRAATPGQSVVLYKGDIILGGGVIKNAVKR